MILECQLRYEVMMAMKESEPYVCDVCKGNHYFIDQDGNVNQCPECTNLGYKDEQEDIPNETRS
jgi:rubrerythrin